MLKLLGDQLIRDPHIAVFELLKNAYDADATHVTVTLNRIQYSRNASIVVEDDGTGMTFDTVLGVWLEPGTDHRARQRAEGRRSPRFGRLPMGEKGIGRFAVHKLGLEVELVTRAAGNDEVVVEIDWEELEQQEYLTDAAFQVIEREPSVFANRTGTRITVSRLREPWTRRMARSLKRSITSMTSPYSGSASFRPQLVLNPDPGWLAGLLDPAEVAESALFHANAEVDPIAWTMSYDYRFAPPRIGRRFQPRRVKRNDVVLGPDKETKLGRRYLTDLEDAARRVRKDARDQNIGIGIFKLELHIFDRDRETRELLADYRGVSGFLNANGGIRVYRDGIRVYDYGEPENDWLELDARRVNVPAQRISNRLVLGSVHLDSEKSRGLIEKTNREGFVETAAYQVFRRAVQAAIQHIVFERNRDKRVLRELKRKPRDASEPVAGAIQDLRDRVRGEGLLDDLGPMIDRAEAEYESFRETLLVSAGAGLTMTVVVHEVEKGVKELNRALDRKASRKHLVDLGLHLAEVIESLGFLARRSDRTFERASDLVAVALRTIYYRFDHHGIQVTNAFNTANDFVIRVQRRLIVGTLLNLFDNSIYWLAANDPGVKRLYVCPTRELGESSGILVADNGPGLLDPPDVLTQPFMTRKSDGMGMGLYISREIMRAHGGELVFPSRVDVDVPNGYGGACVGLRFKEE
jgi:anti-sigma regulatory factor (Ser/Thr protein kinase)